MLVSANPATSNSGPIETSRREISKPICTIINNRDELNSKLGKRDKDNAINKNNALSR